MKSVFVFLAYLALANASDIDFNFEQTEDFLNQDARSINGLNTTMLTYGVGILAGLLLFALYAAASAPSLATEKYQKFGQDQAFYSEEQQFQTRYRRFARHGNVVFSSNISQTSNSKKP